MPIAQKGRSLQIETVLGPDALLIAAASGQEAISRPFSYRVELLSEDLTKEIKPADMIGTSAAIALLLSEGEWRYRSGFFQSFQVGEIRREFRVYRAEIVPWLSFLKLSTNFRIFQNQAVPDILNAVFTEFRLNDLQVSLQKTYDPLDYCVQCRETAFDFVSRLMEENGIFYFFKHSDAGHTLVLADDISAFQKAEQFSVNFTTDAEEPGITAWERSYTYRTGQWEVGDFSYKKPTDPTFKNEKTSSKIPPSNPYDRYTFPGGFKDDAGGSAQARVRMLEEEAAGHTVNGGARCVTFLPGYQFKLSEYKALPDEAGKTFVVTSQSWSAVALELHHNFLDVLSGVLSDAWSTDNAKTVALGAAGGAGPNTRTIITQGIITTLKGLASGGLGAALGLIPALLSGAFKRVFEQQAGFQNQFIAIPADQAFSPARTTEKPEIRGPHTAVVIGTSGMDTSGGDLCCDNFGRVRVKFPWDRSTDNDGTGQTSCWVRVAEAWAGNKWGSNFLPRVGQEVIVEFIDADPDRPIITGRLYNAQNTSTFMDPPSGDPDQSTVVTNFTQSGLRTRSTPTGSKERFHMLRFDDNQGAEQLLLRAQGQMDLSSYGPLYQTIYDDLHLTVGQSGSDDNSGPFHAYFTIKGDKHEHVSGDRFEGVDKGYQLKVTNDAVFSFQQNHTAVIGQTLSLKGTTVVVEGSTKLSLKVGGSFVVIDPSGVAINGPMVKINSGGSADSGASASVTAPTDAKSADPGTSGAKKDQQLGAGFKHDAYPAETKKALDVTPADNGALQVGYSLLVEGSPEYQTQVIQSLSEIAQTPEGEKLLADLDKSGRKVRIQQPPVPFDPPNAVTMPFDERNGRAGAGNDSLVQFDPAQWPSPLDPDQASAAQVLAGQLKRAHGRRRGQT